MRNCPSKSDLFKGRHFEQEIIVLCVRGYLRYKLSYRDLVEMTAGRGMSVAHTTILRWVQRYAPEFASAGAVFRPRQAYRGALTRPTLGSAANGLISTGLSTRQEKPLTSGLARDATSPRPRPSFARPYAPRAARPRPLRWTVMPLPIVRFANFNSKAGSPP